MRPRDPFGAVLLALGLCTACNAATPDPKAKEDEPAAEVAASDFGWDGVSLREHRDAPSRLRFPIPVTGYRVTASHYPETTPPIKLKHEILLEQERREVARIDVWYDVEGRGLTGFFDEYLRFMATADASIERTKVGKRRVDAIVVRHPRSPHSPPQRAVVLALDDRILRITSLDDSDVRARAAVDPIVADLELEAAP